MKNLLVFCIIMWLHPIPCAARELLDSVLNELSAYQVQHVGMIGITESRYKEFADLPVVFRYDNTKDTIYFFEAFYDDGYYRMAMWSNSDTISYSFELGVRRGIMEVRELEKISKWDTASLIKDRREYPVDMRGIPWVSLSRIIMCNNRGTYETVFYWDIPERWLRKRKEREKRMSQKNIR